MSSSGSSSDKDDDPDVFNVECVIAESWDEERKKPLYLIRWEDYDLYEATWETQSSFEEGAEEVLREWAEVKRQRLAGEIPEFDVQNFEVKRAKWMNGEVIEDDSVVVEDKTGELEAMDASPDTDAKQEWNENGHDDSSSSQSFETETLGLLKAQADRYSSPSNVESTNTGQSVRDQTGPLLSERLPFKAEPANKRDTQETFATATKQKIRANEELYKVPETLYTYDKLKQTLKRKCKNEVPIQVVKHEEHCDTTKNEIKRQASISNDDKFRAVRAYETTSTNDLKAKDEQKLSTSQIGSILHVSDLVSKDPHALYDLIVAIRDHRWKLSISKAAYDSVCQTSTITRSKQVKLDYEMLRDKGIISLHESYVPLLGVAARERRTYPEDRKRCVVLGDVHER